MPNELPLNYPFREYLEAPHNHYTTSLNNKYNSFCCALKNSAKDKTYLNYNLEGDYRSSTSQIKDINDKIAQALSTILQSHYENDEQDSTTLKLSQKILKQLGANPNLTKNGIKATKLFDNYLRKNTIYIEEKDKIAKFNDSDLLGNEALETISNLMNFGFYGLVLELGTRILSAREKSYEEEPSKKNDTEEVAQIIKLKSQLLHAAVMRKEDDIAIAYASSIINTEPLNSKMLRSQIGVYCLLTNLLSSAGDIEKLKDFQKVLLLRISLAKNLKGEKIYLAGFLSISYFACLSQLAISQKKQGSSILMYKFIEELDTTLQEIQQKIFKTRLEIDSHTRIVLINLKFLIVKMKFNFYCSIKAFHYAERIYRELHPALDEFDFGKAYENFELFSVEEKPVIIATGSTADQDIEFDDLIKLFNIAPSEEDEAKVYLKFKKHIFFTGPQDRKISKEARISELRGDKSTLRGDELVLKMKFQEATKLYQQAEDFIFDTIKILSKINQLDKRKKSELETKMKKANLKKYNAAILHFELKLSNENIKIEDSVRLKYYEHAAKFAEKLGNYKIALDFYCRALDIANELVRKDNSVENRKREQEILKIVKSLIAKFQHSMPVPVNEKGQLEINSKVLQNQNLIIQNLRELGKTFAEIDSESGSLL